MTVRKVLIGFFLLGALVIFALATFYIENWQFYLQDGYKLAARFPYALELNTGDEVTIAGVEVGRVHSISVDPHQENPVEVIMWLRKDAQVRAGDVASIRMRSIFGGSLLEIKSLDRDAPLLQDGDSISNTHVSMGVAEIIEKSDGVLQEVFEAVQTSRGILQNIASVTDRLERGEGTAGRLLTDDSAYYALQDVLSGASAALGNVTSVTDLLLEGRGLAGVLLTDEGLASEFGSVIVDAGRIMKTMGEVSEQFPQSSLGRLASEDGLYQRLERTLGEMEKALASVSSGDGTVGRLINDPELYMKLTATVDGVQELINEYREQSPILTFAGAVFGAF